MNKSEKRWFLFINFLTISRIIGSIILFPIYFHFGPYVVGSILAALFLTDWIDGYLARKMKVCTFFGSIMDSICDKLIIIFSCIVLCFINPYFILSIISEVLILLISTFNLTQNNTAKASYVGKLKMWVLCTCVVIGFFIPKDISTLIKILVVLPAFIFELITMFTYFKKVYNGKIIIKNEKPKYKSAKDIKMMLFSPEFYEKNKDKKGLLNNIYESE